MALDDVNKLALKASSSVIKVLIEEITHAKYNTSDMSRDHTNKLREICSYRLQDYFMMRKTSQLKALYKARITAYQ